ncbi:MAG: polyphosphate kinase 2 family protein [bacterium]
MFKTEDNKYLVTFNSTFKIKNVKTFPPEDAPGKNECKELLDDLVEELKELQDKLYASDSYSLLLIFQAMDGAGKDSTIRAVMSGINPAGCQVYSFKQPSREELDHDFLWRTAKCLPERGRIGVFNRSYYEEVLVVRVHPEYLAGEKLPDGFNHENFWKHRFETITDHEKHLARNGTVILKFWLNVSKDEQKKRFLKRIDEAEKNWKFSPQDVSERKYWNDYMQAYEEMLNATSKSWAPWFAIPADNKSYARLRVAEIIVENLNKLNLEYPEIKESDRKKFEEMRYILLSE